MTDEELEAYKEAQRRVTEAQASGAMKLDLWRLSSLTTLPPELAKLTDLTVLDVRGTEITDLTPLATLSKLTRLDVDTTPITDFTPLATLTALTSLVVSETQITDLTPLAKLSKLTKLDVAGTQVTDLTPLAKLTALTELDVRSTQVTDLTPLAKLSKLTKLDVAGTQVTDLTPLAKLTALTELDVGFTPITDLTPLAKLSKLTSLVVHGTPITDLTPPAKLTALTELVLSGCTALTRLALPEAMLARLETLRLHDCPLTDLPRELCQRGYFENVARDVHAYIRGLREQGGVVLNECKLIVLGNGRAGKTSAIKALQGDPFDPKEQSTHAIRFWTWTRSLPFAPGGPAEQARVNVWDFGGQDIYHQAHRLFLRTRAVFLVCWNPWEKTATLREDGDEPRALTYWLEQIHALHGDPRILILRTHADCDAAELADRGIAQVPDWRDAVPEKYRRLPSLALGAAAPDARTVRKIHAQLDAAFIAEMSAGSRAVPAGWAAVRTRLHELSAENEAAFRANQRPPHAVLNEQEFATLVEESLAPGVTARDPAEARSFLHDIGALFYDERLGGRVVLDQRWCIEGIYAVLLRGPLHEWLSPFGGMVTSQMLAEVWRALRYTEKEQELLLSFMLSCEQAVELMQPGETRSGETVYLVPGLLPTEQEMAEHPAPEPKGEQTRFGGWAGEGLGADVARAFIVAAAKEFRRGGRYWRWGAEITSEKLGATARVEWKAIDAFGYGGELTITLWGPPERAAKLGGAVYEQLQRCWPDQVRALPGTARRAPELRPERRENREPLKVVSDPPGTANGRTLTFSLSGEDSAHPGLEGAPTALYRALAEAARSKGWRVFYYKHSTDQPEMDRLLSFVGKGDYVVVFLSARYLRSRYCMEELRVVYGAKPKGRFAPERTRLFALGDWKPKTKRGWDVLKKEWEKERKKWQSEFNQTIAPFTHDRKEVNKMFDQVPTLGWFHMCADPAKLAVFLASLNDNYIASPAPLPFTEGDVKCETWLAKWTAEIYERLR